MVSGTVSEIFKEAEATAQEAENYPGSDGIIRDLERQAAEMVESKTRIADRDKVTTATSLTKRVMVDFRLYDVTITVKVDMKAVVYKEK